MRTVLLAVVLCFGWLLQGNDRVRVAATTSLAEIGILTVFAGAFEKETGLAVQILAVGSGVAFVAGRNGDADLLLVHSPDDEESFMAAGYGVEHQPIMYNEFVVVGPPSDPAAIRGMKDAVAAFRKIAERGAVFVSRGDRSGTHRIEERLWHLAEVANPHKRCRYLSVGQGMSATLRIADERGGYTVVDRATYQMLRSSLSLEVFVSGDALLSNRYAAILVKPRNPASPAFATARRFMSWLSSPTGRSLIERFSLNGVRVFSLESAR